MKNHKFPKFIQFKPHCVDKYEGRSGERIAEAIENHVKSIDLNPDQSEELPKIIGLEGEWGSGKSNVIGILKKNIAEEYYLFEYDAWGHQEDLQRRSFLETLTDELITAENGDLLPKKCSKEANNKKLETWKDKLKNLLARKRETILTTIPKISAGIIGAILLFVFTPISSAIASDTDLTIWLKLLIASIPVIIALLVWGISSCIKKEVIWSELFEIYGNEKIKNTTNETISESEPSVKEFKEWMNDLSNDLKKKLIIVFDNMDRLPADKVKELWSSIHTFFSDNSYKNIWVIITFDRGHLANAFGDKNGNVELTNHFINKSFPVIYRVAPPVLTDWKKVFNEFYEEAFGDNENESRETIQQLFSLIKPHFTPRDIIAFINELVSLKQTWKDEIPLISMAVFSLKKEEILESPIESILSGNYLNSVEKIIENTEELQGFIAALTYGIDVEMATQVPLIQYIQKTLKGLRQYDINKYSGLNHFMEVLDDQIKNLDPSILDTAIMSLSKFNVKKGNTIINLWNKLAKMHIKQKVDSLNFIDVHKILLLNVDDFHKNQFTKYLCDSFRNHKEFDGKLYYLSMQSVESFIDNQKIKISLDQYFTEKTVEPEIFVNFVNQAKEKYPKYKLLCDNEDLNDFLVGLMPSSLPSMEFIKYLKDNKSYSFEDLEERIEIAISGNEVDESNFPEIMKTYKFISKEKPLKQQFTSEQIQNLIAFIEDKSTDAYFDLVAMGLSNQLIDTPYAEGLDIKVAERIEYYKSYGALLIQSVDWASVLLRKSIKNLTETSYGQSKMNIEQILPQFEQIKTAISVSKEDFLNRLNAWKKFAKEEIDISNLHTLIPNHIFFKYSSEISNALTNHINKVAIAKLKTIPVDELYAQRTTPTYYWHNCASLLIQGGVLSLLPLNFIEYCKKILRDISDKILPIPSEGDFNDVFLNKADKRKMQATIKTIRDNFCNSPNSITPELFMFFTTIFDFVNKKNSRHGDITRNILHPVISNAKCLNHILENSSGYINTIVKAGEDAEDLKIAIRQLLETSYSEELFEFASAIGIEEEL